MRSTILGTRTLHGAAIVAAALLSVVLIGPGLADAGLGAGATPTFPAVVTVGDTGVPATIQMQNDNTTPNTSATLCNFGDPFPCPVGDPGITLIPSCGQLGLFSVCAPAGADPGVFLVSATGVGRVGSACAGTTFAITLIDPVFGQLRFTPEPAAAHVVLPTVGSICAVDFTFDVLRSPTVDQDPTVAGVQTVQVVDFTEQDGGSVTASARGTSIGTRVERAPTAIATIATTNITIGGGVADQATVSGRVNPQPGATIDFRLYGPSDTNCSGPTVFESLSVPYPVAGGPVTSATFTPSTAGTYRWVATYSGDVNNAPSSGACTDSNEGSVVTPASPTLATIASLNLVVGGAVSDQATLSGRINPQPGATVDFRLYGPDDVTCSGPSVFDSLGVAVPVTDEPVASASFTPSTAGTYRWVAAYSGDINNQAVPGVCNGDNEAVEVFPTPPGPQSHAPPASVPVPPSASLPATGSGDIVLLRMAFAVSITGFLLVAATRRRRSQGPAPVG